MIDKTNEKINFDEIHGDERNTRVNNLGIYELRGLARALGIPSPTTKKRDYLVSAIIDRLDKNEVTLVQRSGKGRPFKRLEGMDNILTIIDGQNVKQFEKDKECTYDDILLFAQEIPVFESFKGEAVDKKGVLRITASSSYFIDIESEGVVFVDENLIMKNNARNGDILIGKAFAINAKGQYRMDSITSINGIEASKYVAPAEGNYEKVLPNKTINKANKELLCGSRNVLVVDEPVFLSTENTLLLTEKFNDFDRVIALGINLCAEDIMLFNSMDSRAFKFTSIYGEDNKTRNFNCIIDAINLCERFVASGDKVLFIAYDIANIINALDIFFDCPNAITKLGHMNQTTVVIERLISLAAEYSNGAGCTELLLCNDLDLSDMFVKSSIVKISKRIK